MFHAAVKGRWAAAVACVCFFSLVGCASTPTPITLPALPVAAGEPVGRIAHIKEFSILNKAPTAQNGSALFDDLLAAIQTSPATGDTVADDLERLLSSRLQVSSDASLSIRATIRKAEAHWVFDKASRIPVVGLFLVGRDSDFQLSLNVLFEVEQQGQVLRNYVVEDVVKIRASAMTAADIQAGYRKLVEAYREQTLPRIEREFLRRYLTPPAAN